tara:strand:- start:3535 stop:3888 length:354 start_codon:yes stop_codon:yes gene_type:complete
MKSRTIQYVESTVKHGDLLLHLFGEMDADGTTVVEPRTWEYPGSRDTTIDWKSLGFGGILTIETEMSEIELEVDLCGKEAELLLEFFGFYPDELDEENWDEVEDDWYDEDYARELYE